MVMVIDRIRDSYRFSTGPVSRLIFQVVPLSMLKAKSLVRRSDGLSVTANDDPADIVSSKSAIYLDQVIASDEPFLYQVYASTRAEEMELTPWSAEQREMFLRMQYEAQRRSYQTEFPEAKYSVIRCEGVALGRLIVNRTPEEIHILDVALLPEFRRLGIGSKLMADILEEASLRGQSVRLYVERFNPALRWYEKLGFREVNSGPIYLEMIWRQKEICSGQDQAENGQRSGVVHVGVPH
jgi:ribosomal protein S18 acetylase RimI-like enzyme